MTFKDKIQTLIQGYENGDQISNLRLSRLIDISIYYLKFGFPNKLSKFDKSLIPLTFQEANYDDIHWTDKNAELRHLSSILEIDCMFQNEGKNRCELSEEEFKNYIKFSFNSIDINNG